MRVWNKKPAPFYKMPDLYSNPDFRKSYANLYPVFHIMYPDEDKDESFVVGMLMVSGL